MINGKGFKILVIGLVTIALVLTYWFFTTSYLPTSNTTKPDLQSEEPISEIDNYRNEFNKMWANFKGSNKYQIPEYKFAASGPIRWEKLPLEVQNAMTLGGKIPLEVGFSQESTDNPTWNFQTVEEWIKDDTNMSTCHENYQYSCRCFLRAFKEFPVKDKTALVLGSLTPWLEAIVLAHGATKVVTTDFNLPVLKGNKTVPLEVKTFDEIDEIFDVVLTYSSIEHDGLGRYGDPINPFGDILRMRALKNVLKPNGLMFLGVPVGKDGLSFNLHRIYGEIRFPLLSEGYEYLNFFPNVDRYPHMKTWSECLNHILWDWNNQPVVVLQNIP